MSTKAKQPEKRKRQSVGSENEQRQKVQASEINVAQKSAARRSTRFWRPAGDLVLESAKPQVQFLVEKATVTKCSAFMDDIIGDLKKHQNGTVDGFPRLSINASEEEIEVLLKMAYESKEFLTQTFPARSRPDPPTLEGLLDVANKFKIFTLRQRILEVIKYDLPSFRIAESDFGPFHDLEDSDPGGSQCRKNLCETLCLTGKYSMDDFFCPAYWRLLASSTKDQLTEAFDSLDPKLRARLTMAEPANAFRVRKHIRRTAMEYAFGWLADGLIPTEHCSDALSCVETKVDILTKLFEKDTDTIVRYCLTQSELDFDRPLGHKFCKMCNQYVLYFHSKGQKALWSDFGRIYATKTKGGKKEVQDSEQSSDEEADDKEDDGKEEDDKEEDDKEENDLKEDNNGAKLISTCPATSGEWYFDEEDEDENGSDIDMDM